MNWGYLNWGDPAEERRRRIAYLLQKQARKRALIARGSLQARFHKAQLIIAPKGRNGRSMSTALLAAHGIKSPTKEGA